MCNKLEKSAVQRSCSNTKTLTTFSLDSWNSYLPLSSSLVAFHSQPQHLTGGLSAAQQVAAFSLPRDNQLFITNLNLILSHYFFTNQFITEVYLHILAVYNILALYEAQVWSGCCRLFMALCTPFVLKGGHWQIPLLTHKAGTTSTSAVSSKLTIWYIIINLCN